MKQSIVLLAAAAVATATVANVLMTLAGDAPAAGRTTTMASATRVEYDYVLHCGGCHRLDGTGSAQVPTLHGISRYLDAGDGRQYLVRVPGIAQAPLDDARLADLLNYVLEEFGGGSASPPFGVAEVRRYRDIPLVDPVALREQLLAELQLGAD